MAEIGLGIGTNVERRRMGDFGGWRAQKVAEGSGKGVLRGFA
jgi:hypothetical protein